MFEVNKINNTYIISLTNTNRFNTIIAKRIKGRLIRLIEQPGIGLILDFKGIHFIDSNGFDTLLVISKAAKTYGSKFYMYNISEEVRELINLVQLNNVFANCCLDTTEYKEVIQTS